MAEANQIGIANVSRLEDTYTKSSTNMIDTAAKSTVHAMRKHVSTRRTDMLFRHKIVAKRGAAFTVMVAGESGLGKTTFINTLFSTTIKNYADHKRRHHKQIDKTVEIEITKAELEEKFFKGEI